MRGIHRRPVNSPHKWPVTRKMFPCNDVILVDFIPWTNNDERHRVWSSDQARPSGKVSLWASLSVIALDYKIQVFEPLMLTEMGDILQTDGIYQCISRLLGMFWFKFQLGVPGVHSNNVSVLCAKDMMITRIPCTIPGASFTECFPS